MNMKKTSILIITIVLLSSVLSFTALADTVTNKLSVTLQLFDEDMLLIDEINEDGLNSSYSKYTYPMNTEYIKVIAVTDDVADEIDITINADKYREYPHKDISEDQQCYIDIVVTDSATNKESKFNIQLDRAAVARDNTITSVGWSMYDSNENPVPTADISLVEGGIFQVVPNTVSRISLDYFDVVNDFTTVKVVGDDGSEMIGNNEPITIEMSKDETTVYIEGQIDNSFRSYSVTFQKMAEVSNDNKLMSVEIEGYSETDYFAPAVVEIMEGMTEYRGIVSNDVTEFCIYPHTSHVMATVECSAEGMTTDENGVTYYPFTGSSVMITIDVTAENGEKLTYNVAVLKENDITYDGDPVDRVEEETFFQKYMIFIIPGIIILIAVGVFVFMQIRRNKY